MNLRNFPSPGRRVARDTARKVERKLALGFFSLTRFVQGEEEKENTRANVPGGDPELWASVPVFWGQQQTSIASFTACSACCRQLGSTSGKSNQYYSPDVTIISCATPNPPTNLGYSTARGRPRIRMRSLSNQRLRNGRSCARSGRTVAVESACCWTGLLDWGWVLIGRGGTGEQLQAVRHRWTPQLPLRARVSERRTRYRKGGTDNDRLPAFLPVSAVHASWGCGWVWAGRVPIRSMEFREGP